MDQWMIVVVVFGAVLTATAATAWGQWLETRRRTAALDVIKTAIAHGKDPPREVLDQASHPTARPPWSEVVVFTALSFGFWIAYGRSAGEDQQTAFMVVAATMTATAAGCLILALMTRPPASKPDDE